ncbi:MAG: hypothetical protein ACREBW_02850 [Candidatus Micrarchaeaceae archaeon]
MAVSQVQHQAQAAVSAPPQKPVSQPTDSVNISPQGKAAAAVTHDGDGDGS